MATETTLLVLVAILGVACTVFSLKKWQRRIGNIPGPWGLPLIGYLPYLAPSTLNLTMNKLIEKYGAVFKLKLGSYDAIIITDYELIKKAFRNPDLSQRPNMFMFEATSQGYHGLIGSSGELWHEQRRFALRQLRDLGMGKSSIEVYIEREAMCMTELLRKSIGEPIDLNNSLNIAITNIVWAIVTGERMEYDDPVFLGFMAALKRSMEIGASIGILGFIPWLKYFLPQAKNGANIVKETIKTVDNYFKDIVIAHKNAFNPNDVRDYTDYFIEEQMRQGKNTTFTDRQLRVSMFDLFVAGGETTATTLRWGVLLLASYPAIQQKLQDEIDNVVGKERRPTMDDRERMPYTDAVIHEIQRYADIVPMGLFHSSIQNIQLEGFTIPKNTLVMGYAGAVHRSKKYWAKPYEFYPEHFLDEDGSLRKNIEGFIPFSTGKRQCLGENLARAELFIFIAYFFQIFNFTLHQNPKPSMEGDPLSGIVRWPSPYKVVLKIR